MTKNKTARSSLNGGKIIDGGKGEFKIKDKTDFKFLYPMEMKLRGWVHKITKVVYGVDDVSWTFDVKGKAKILEADPKYDEYTVMMMKTHLSLTHDPALKGVSKGWAQPIQDVLLYSGAKFPRTCARTVSLMPGTSSVRPLEE